jgi:hypothetical protein
MKIIRRHRGRTGRKQDVGKRPSCRISADGSAFVIEPPAVRGCGSAGVPTMCTRASIAPFPMGITFSLPRRVVAPMTTPFSSRTPASSAIANVDQPPFAPAHQHRHQRLPARDHPRVLVAGQHLARFRERIGPDIVEGRGFHGCR